MRPASWQHRLAAPRRAPQPASAGEDFPSSSRNKGPPAVGLSGSLCARPQGLCAAATRAEEAPALRQGPGAVVWPLLGSVRSPPSPHRQSPPCPAPEPSTEHPQVLSSPLVPLHGKLSPGPSWRGAVWPSPGLGGGAGGSYLHPRGFEEPPPPAGLAPRSGQRSSARPLPLPPLLPLRYPGNLLLLPPANQPTAFTWRLAANGRPRHPGPLAGSRALSQARGPKREAGVSLERLLLKGGPLGGLREVGRESHLVLPFWHPSSSGPDTSRKTCIAGERVERHMRAPNSVFH